MEAAPPTIRDQSSAVNLQAAATSVLFDRACAGGELTTVQARELCRLALQVCELELENAALKGRMDALRPGTFAPVAGDGGRPDWDTYFLRIADVVATRSPDRGTQHGCVIVDSDRRIVSTGYNGPVAGLRDEAIPLTRPAKHDWIIHAEDNAALFARPDLAGCTVYVTGLPCTACLRRLLQAGVTRIVTGPRWSQCMTAEEHAAGLAMAAQCGVAIETPRPETAVRGVEGT